MIDKLGGDHCEPVPRRREGLRIEPRSQRTLTDIGDIVHTRDFLFFARPDGSYLGGWAICLLWRPSRGPEGREDAHAPTGV